jgi:hypothetical protein
LNIIVILVQIFSALVPAISLLVAIGQYKENNRGKVIVTLQSVGGLIVLSVENIGSNIAEEINLYFNDALLDFVVSDRKRIFKRLSSSKIILAPKQKILFSTDRTPLNLKEEDLENLTGTVCVHYKTDNKSKIEQYNLRMDGGMLVNNRSIESSLAGIHKDFTDISKLLEDRVQTIHQ